MGIKPAAAVACFNGYRKGDDKDWTLDWRRGIESLKGRSAALVPTLQR
jgi:hypothetical protein